ncbi:hypothetical protein D3218_03340 [Aureimonas flava]|uniref:Lipoprotein n=1 Tax=Aureimonas flava TaxID=2320271 RepID=A0A3A1WNV8_9HYPH|nr:hypothetical protein [Aureimonas flava]RIY02425.1 hypothetical protein D3218_03340 [Aureimonas flava]
MRPILALALLAPLTLAACATVTPAERRAADEARCRDYGFRPGTDAFAACLQRIDLDRSETRRARLYGEPVWTGGVGVGIGYGRIGW